MNIYVLVVLLCSSNHSVLHSVSHVALSLSFSFTLSPFSPSIYLSFFFNFCFLYHISPSAPLSLLLSLFISFLSPSSSLFMSPSAPSVLFFLFSLRPSFSPSLSLSFSCRRRKSLSCWLLKCEEWQIWWFLTAVAGLPRFISPHCPLWSWRSDLQAKYTKHESGGFKYLNCFDVCLIYVAQQTNKWTHLMQ